MRYGIDTREDLDEVALRDRWDRGDAVMRAKLEDFEEEHFRLELGLLCMDPRARFGTEPPGQYRGRGSELPSVRPMTSPNVTIFRPTLRPRDGCGCKGA